MNSCRIVRSSSRPETSRKMQNFWYYIVTACYWFKVSSPKKKNIWLTKIKLGSHKINFHATKTWLQMFSHDLWAWNWIWNPRACNQPLLLMSMQLSSEYTPEYNRDGLDSTCMPVERIVLIYVWQNRWGDLQFWKQSHTTTTRMSLEFTLYNSKQYYCQQETGACFHYWFFPSICKPDKSSK